MSQQQTNRRAEPGRSNPMTTMYSWMFGILIGATLSAWVGLAMASKLGNVNPDLPRDPFKIYADLVEDQTHARMDAARERAGVTVGSAAQRELAAGVRRTWAWPEIVVALVVLVVFVVTLVL